MFQVPYFLLSTLPVSFLIFKPMKTKIIYLIKNVVVYTGYAFFYFSLFRSIYSLILFFFNI